MMPSLNDSNGKSLFSQEEATSFHVVMTGWRHNQHHRRDTQMDCSTTHLMFKYPPFLVDANKWCDNKVDTRDVHCAIIPLHGSLRRTQIVRSVSKVAWTRVRRMPCDQTHNHAWRVAHQISLHAQQTHWCKCGKRITVDHVHFECRFVKPLWSIIAQANRLTVNGIDTTNTTGIS